MSTDVEAFISSDIDVTVTQKRQVPDTGRELAASDFILSFLHTSSAIKIDIYDPLHYV